MSRTRTQSGAGGGVRLAQGQYTGNGAVTLTINGIGFRPRFVQITSGDTTNMPAQKNDTDGLNTSLFWRAGPGFRYRVDMIISLDADGFTVGDGTGFIGNIYNILNADYYYVCFG